MKNYFKLLVLMPSALCFLGGCSSSTEGQHVSLAKEVISVSYEDDLTLKGIYEYDDKGNTTLQETYCLNNDTKEYEFFSGNSYEYNSNNDIVSSILYRADAEGKKTAKTKNCIEYDGKKVIKRESFTYNNSGELSLNSYSSDFKYDSLDRILEFDTYKLDASSNEFKLSNDVKYEYLDNFEQPIKITENTYNGDEVSTLTSSYTLDKEGRVLTLLAISGNVGQFDSYVYNEDGKVSSNSTYTYNVETKQFKLVVIIECSYINKYYPSLCRYTYFNDNSVIRRLIEEERTYDDKMNVLSAKSYDSSYSSSERVLIEETNYSY